MKSNLFIPKTESIEKNDFLVEMATGKNILDIGLGGHVSNEAFTSEYLKRDLSKTLHGRLTNIAESITGTDINNDCVIALSAQYPNNSYVTADLTDFNFKTKFSKKFDLIILGDVIEHLDDFKSALQNIKTVTSDNGKIIITTVNAYSIIPFFKMFMRYESVHDEHTAYFSYITMKRLCAMNKLEIIDFKFYSKDRNKFDSKIDAISHYLGKAFSKLLPQFSPGLIFVLSPLTHEGAHL